MDFDPLTGTFSPKPAPATAPPPATAAVPAIRLLPPAAPAAAAAAVPSPAPAGVSRPASVLALLAAALLGRSTASPAVTTSPPERQIVVQLGPLRESGTSTDSDEETTRAIFRKMYDLLENDSLAFLTKDRLCYRDVVFGMILWQDGPFFETSDDDNRTGPTTIQIARSCTISVTDWRLRAMARLDGVTHQGREVECIQFSKTAMTHLRQYAATLRAAATHRHTLRRYARAEGPRFEGFPTGGGGYSDGSAKYRCDLCLEETQGLCYHCDECTNYDECPACFSVGPSQCLNGTFAGGHPHRLTRHASSPYGCFGSRCDICLHEIAACNAVYHCAKCGNYDECEICHRQSSSTSSA